MGDNDQDSLTEASTNGEVIPPNKKDSSVAGNIYAEIAAQITQYTDRPDLLLEVIEKHDPGFIKGMNDEARDFSKRYRLSRFRFGRFQSYASTFVAIVAAFAILFILYTLAINNHLSFWPVVGLAIMYAITQSGPTGFIKIANQLVKVAKAAMGDNKPKS